MPEAEALFDGVAHPDALRRTMAEFPSGVTVVTTVVDGIAHALTATAFSSVSLQPPLVLFCVAKTSRFHAAVLRSRAWAASVLAGHQEAVARHFSVRGRDLLTQFDVVAHTPAPITGSPLLGGALAWLDCDTFAEHDAGDHTIVVGLVRDTAVVSAGARPLTYQRGRYGTLA